jgi:thiol-disulfide isomerase/thioredoxin
MRQRLVIGALALAVAAIVAVTGCAPPAQTDEGAGSAPFWMDIELKDVRTGETFRISDFKGRPILLESFAVWCPTCTAQQRQIGRLKDIEGESIVHISLDTDPNEDEARITEHLERNGFDWYYAVSPIELTQALMDEFGLAIVNAPGAPIALICEDLSTRFLRTGVKTADDLLAEVEKGCD